MPNHSWWGEEWIIKLVLLKPLDVHCLQHYQVDQGQLLQGVSEQIHMVGRCGGHMLAVRENNSQTDDDVLQNSKHLNIKMKNY